MPHDEFLHQLFEGDQTLAFIFVDIAYGDIGLCVNEIQDIEFLHDVSTLGEHGRGQLDQKVDRLVRHDSVGEIVLGTANDLSDGGIGIKDAVVSLVTLGDFFEDADECVLGRLGQHDLFKALHDAVVGLDVLMEARVVGRGDKLQGIAGDVRVDDGHDVGVQREPALDEGRKVLDH